MMRKGVIKQKIETKLSVWREKEENKVRSYLVGTLKEHFETNKALPALHYYYIPLLTSMRTTPV